MTSHHRVGKLTILGLAGLFMAAAPASVAVAGYRVAYSADGNAADWDDIGSAGMALAILAQGLGSEKWRLVYFEYNNNIGTGHETDGTAHNPTMYSHMTTTVTQGITQFGFPTINPVTGRSTFYNAYANPTAAQNALAASINEAWSAGDSMYIIAAGPMETVWRGVNAANPNARSNVTVISHSPWNDSYGGSGTTYPGIPPGKTKDDHHLGSGVDPNHGSKQSGNGQVLSLDPGLLCPAKRPDLESVSVSQHVLECSTEVVVGQDGCRRSARRL